MPAAGDMQMQCVPEVIGIFLQQHQVLSMAVCNNDIPWSASAFFAYDDARQRLLFLSSLQTRHGELLSVNPKVAGTIAAQFVDIDQIHGLQFFGNAQMLHDPLQTELALQLYYQRFPQARGINAPIWEISLLQLKLTDNRLGFGTKIHWCRNEDSTSASANCTAMQSLASLSL